MDDREELNDAWFVDNPSPRDHALKDLGVSNVGNLLKMQALFASPVVPEG